MIGAWVVETWGSCPFVLSDGVHVDTREDMLSVALVETSNSKDELVPAVNQALQTSCSQRPCHCLYLELRLPGPSLWNKLFEQDKLACHRLALRRVPEGIPLGQPIQFEIRLDQAVIEKVCACMGDYLNLFIDLAVENEEFVMVICPISPPVQDDRKNLQAKCRLNSPHKYVIAKLV